MSRHFSGIAFSGRLFIDGDQLVGYLKRVLDFACNVFVLNLPTSHLHEDLNFRRVNL